MKYWCKNCEQSFDGDKQTLTTDPQNGKVLCPNCSDNGCGTKDFIYVQPVSDYETIEQREKRTGKPVDDDTAVWYCYPHEHIDPKTKQKTGEIRYSRWLLADYYKVRKLHFMGGLGARLYRVVVADPPIPPPDGWVPEVSE
jgi:DNA-directed RNA polymerase subunit RPC12/RpoP